MNKLCFFLVFINSLGTIGQIQIGGDIEKVKTEKKTKPKKENPKKESDETTEVFLGTNWSHTYRRLVENETIFGDSLGTRTNEKGIPAWSFGVGIRSKFHPHFMWEGGISYLKNGESYSFKGQDTSHSYTNNYRFVAMPLKIYFIHGAKKWRFHYGFGAIPQMALKFKQTSTTRNTEGVEENQLLKTKIGYNSFVFSVVATIGVEYQLTHGWGVYALPEYRTQLNSSYLNTNKFKHFGNAVGMSIGVVKNL